MLRCYSFALSLVFGGWVSDGSGGGCSFGVVVAAVAEVVVVVNRSRKCCRYHSACAEIAHGQNNWWKEWSYFQKHLKKNERLSCTIENFAQTHICRMREILRLNACYGFLLPCAFFVLFCFRPFLSRAQLLRGFISPSATFWTSRCHKVSSLNPPRTRLRFYRGGCWSSTPSSSLTPPSPPSPLLIMRYVCFSPTCSLWPIRFLVVAASFGCVLFIPEPAVFGVYAEVARVLSIVWMLFQVRCRTAA